MPSTSTKPEASAASADSGSNNNNNANPPAPKRYAPADKHQGVPPPPYTAVAPAPLGEGNTSDNNKGVNQNNNTYKTNGSSSSNHNNNNNNTSNPNHNNNDNNNNSNEIDEDMLEDHVSFMRTVNAFHHYRRQASAARDLRRTNFHKLQNQHRDLLCIDLEEMLRRYSECIEANSDFFECICGASEELFDSYWPQGTTLEQRHVPPPTALDMDKVFSTLRQFVRDWSAEGLPERECVYAPILETLEQCFPDRAARGAVRVLIPGAGLCRLSVELALRGFFAQANEFSYHMLIAGHYIQNYVLHAHQHRIYPYCDNTSNLVNRADQFAEVVIPDLCAAEAIEALDARGLQFGELSMIAGDFTEVYAKPEQHRSWSAVTTCFFIDTAHNIIEYLEIIYNLLVPGGFWVNVGPLLYHFADNADDLSIELSLGEVLTVAQKIGFALRSPPKFIDTTYTNNQRSMKQLVYRCAFFVLQRPAEGEAGEAAGVAAPAPAPAA